jgi:site-specific recombinase XerD
MKRKSNKNLTPESNILNSTENHLSADVATDESNNSSESQAKKNESADAQESEPESATDDQKQENSQVNQENIEETYRKKAKRTPLRFLALPPLYKIEKLTLDGYDQLCAKVREDETFRDIPTSGDLNLKACLINRACHLLFALVESGGLVKGEPDKKICKLKINTVESLEGFVQPTLLMEDNVDDNDFSLNPSRMIPVSKSYGFRRSLYAYARFHLSTFVRFRIVVGKASDDDFLLPRLNTSGEEYKLLCRKLPWFADIKFVDNIGWREIFRAWLKFQTNNKYPNLRWSNVAQVAVWRLCERDRYPFLTAARRELYRSPAIPAAKFKEILSSGDLSFETTKKSSAEKYESGKLFVNDQQFENPTDAEKEISSSFKAQTGDGNEKKEGNFGYVSRLLTSLARSENKNLSKLADSLIEESNSPQLAGPGEQDLRNLLRWTAVSIETANSTSKSVISTFHTYASRTLTALFSMPQLCFAEWTTEDVSEYLENYTTHASVTNVRTALRLYDDFLVKNGEAQAGHISWQSRLLHAPTVYEARDVISEKEYDAIRRFVCNPNRKAARKIVKSRDLAALMLLRRCGLRVGEAVHLTTRNFTGFKEWILKIDISKTRAGIRNLPLYLLLDKEEISELREYIELIRETSGEGSHIFVNHKNSQPYTAAAFGRHIEFLISGAKIKGETAHGLRHAFASSLFAAFWMNLTATRRLNDKGMIYRTLKKYARPEIEGRAVTSLIYLQQLLGHADLRVSFERYVHLLEFALADSVQLYEMDQSIQAEFLHKNQTAWFLGMNVESLNKEFDLTNINSINLFKVCRLAEKRLIIKNINT